MWFRNRFNVLILILFLAALPAAAQRRTKAKTVKKPVTVEKVEEAKAEAAVKKNGRPESLETQTQPAPGKKNSKTAEIVKNVDVKTSKPVYFYEFSRPEFIVEKIVIEHDESGAGTIRFMKKYYEEEVADPLNLSPRTIEKLRKHWENLDFLNSKESYQFEKDYSHLGNIKLTMKRDGRERSADFNWTTVEDAKALADEYRRISNQYIWIFDINLSRENQPLESAKLMDSLASQIKRNEIADPEQLLPFLKTLSNDERMPLLSRNHALRIAKDIEKNVAKKKDEN
ncbi:MAG: hypothetical protein KIS76_18475 [Pyrinomonadaceae bacterium]|nr:hypothetical protein [Pyrinomonadaceae bacterium]